MIKDYFEDKAEVIINKMEKTSKSKLIKILLTLVLVGVIGLGFLQFKWNIESPFLRDQMIEDKAAIRGPREFYEFYIQDQKNKENITNLQKKDSDSDGLTDYQEIYIYRTNAYSNDTDNDEIEDGIEVKNGTDPKCKSGVLCDADGFILQENIPISQVETTSETSINTSIDNLTLKEKDQIKNYFKSLDNDSIRLMLVQQGYPQEEVDKLTDLELKTTLDAILSKL